MTITVSCLCGNTFEAPDSSSNATQCCLACQQAMNAKQSCNAAAVTSGTPFCRHCNAEAPHDSGTIMRTSFMPEKLSGFWGLLFDLKKVTARRCLTCGHLELFAKSPVGFWG